jgi:hypothetical protein
MARLLTARQQELHDADFSIAADVTCDCPHSMSDDEHERVCRPYQIYYLKTFSDPSVGIFGGTASPTFRSEAEVEAWIEALSEKDFKELGS